MDQVIVLFLADGTEPSIIERKILKHEDQIYDFRAQVNLVFTKIVHTFT